MSVLSLDHNPWSDAVERVFAMLFEFGGRDATERFVMVAPSHGVNSVTGPFVDTFGNGKRIPCVWGDVFLYPDDAHTYETEVRAVMENHDPSERLPFIAEIRNV